MSPPTRTERSRATRTAILQAATRCFGRRGYRGVSMDEIATEAGVTKPTVYAHAGSKNDLFTAVLRSVLDRLDDMPLADVIRVDDLGPALESYARQRIDVLLGDPTLGLLRAASAQGIEQPEWAHALMQSLGTSRFEAWLESANRRGLLRTGPPEEVAELFWAQIEGALFFPAVVGMAPVPDGAQRRRIIASSVRLFLSAYGTSPRADGTRR